MTDQESTLHELMRKRQACAEILRGLGRVVVAFSAGVDSTLLVALAAEVLGTANMLAATGVSPSLAKRELEEARRLAKHLGVELVEVPTGEMDDSRYVANPADRCYYCKADLFRRLAEVARQRGCDAVVSGANADDAGDYRPGLRAGGECGVRNPLMDAGLTKDEIRALSRLMGLPTWDKPAMACLASRIPYGERITADRLGRVEAAESFLKDAGFTACRVRDYDALARIEVPTASLPALLAARDGVTAAFKALGYIYVTMDLEGLRSGSLNQVL